MTFKLVCLDMDGTLLNSSKEVSNRNKEAIKKAHDMGVKIAISTGRVFTSAKYYAQLLGINAPIIASNGAYIREKDRNKVIYSSTLSIEECKKILGIIKNYDFKVYFNTFNTIISPKPYPKGYTYLEMNEDLSDDMKINLHVNPNLEEEFVNRDGEILKAICISEDYSTLKKAKDEIINLKSFEVVSSLGDNFEVMKKGISKGNAVKILTEFYGFKREEVICIGDGENDLSMIKYAGLGVAMGNAPDYVKKEADYITETNDKDGVAEIIEKFILQ